MKQLFLCFLLLVLLTPLCGEHPIVKWKDLIGWLEKYYYYPEIESPNFDWPSSYCPRRLEDNTVLALDGTRLPVMAGAYHLRMSGEDFTDFFPVTGVSFYLKYESAKEAKRVFENVVQFFRKNFKKELRDLPWENGGVYKEVAIRWAETENTQTVLSGKIDLCGLDVVVPGTSADADIDIPDAKGHITVAYSVKNVRHFYFFRTNLPVAEDKVALSDGTVIPLIPGKKVCKIDAGNSQLGGKTTGASLSYEYRVWQKDDKTFVGSYYDDEYVKLYTFYAKHFKIPAEKWEAYQEADFVFVLSYNDARLEIQIRVDGVSRENGKHTDLKPFYNWLKKNRSDLLPYNESGFFVFIQFYGKHQVIPGSEEAPLPKYRKYADHEYDNDTIMLVEENDWEYENSPEEVPGWEEEGYSGDEEGLLDVWGSVDDDSAYESYSDEEEKYDDE